MEKGIRGLGGNIGVSDFCSIKLGSDIGQGSGVDLDREMRFRGVQRVWG